jgi:hypothetical protein
MLKWLFVMMAGHTAVLILHYQLEEHSDLMAAAVSIPLIMTITLVCVDQMARHSK